MEKLDIIGGFQSTFFINQNSTKKTSFVEQ